MKRAKLLCIVFSIFSLISLGSWFFMQRAQDAQDAELAQQASQSAAKLQADMAWSRQQLMLTSQKSGMLEILRDPVSRSVWKPQIDQYLGTLTRDNPGRIDEACLIDPRGAELARVVEGTIPPESDLCVSRRPPA
jgi:hypothetical protein